MVTNLLKKLGTSDFVKNKVRNNTYIKNVDCKCEIEEKVKKNVMFGKNCFCKLNYDLFGSNSVIKTHITQPTFSMRMEITPENFTEYAETTPLK